MRSNDKPPTQPPAGPAAKAGIRSTVLRELRDALGGLHAPTVVASIVAMAVLIVARHHGSPGEFRKLFGAAVAGHPMKEVFPFLYWFFGSGGLYLAVCLLAAALTPGIRCRETGLGLGDKKAGLWASGLMLAVFMPVVVVASFTPAFAGHYPMCQAAKASWTAFLLYEAGHVFYFIGWEYLFRGYLLFSLEKSMGRLAAFATMMPFAIAHYGKPEAEVFGSIVAGIALGLLALRTRTFWYGALVHIVVAVSMDFLVAVRALGFGGGR